MRGIMRVGISVPALILLRLHFTSRAFLVLFRLWGVAFSVAGRSLSRVCGDGVGS
ncbi:hypothetical protein BC939DRAFT_470101, partial [Gamsiella multidivaricata]|uniref:uncharacterized protein n=1 Tax=Gamsiella multidivaricata TaxID=101098 RepID=UPI00221FE31F